MAQENSPNHLVNTFFNIYEDKSTDEAFDYIFSTNNLISKSDVGLIKSKISKYRNALGDYYGKEMFVTQKINETIEVQSYILKYENQPLRFIFTFYKPNKGWKIQNFKISDTFIEEVEEASITLKYK